jgi:hypothetical protein
VMMMVVMSYVKMIFRLITDTMVIIKRLFLKL